MTGEIDVHNKYVSSFSNGKIDECCWTDAPVLADNGKIDEYCGMETAALVDVPDCSCGDCDGPAGFGRVEERSAASNGFVKGSLNGKEGVGEDGVRVAVKGSIGVGDGGCDITCADRKGIVEHKMVEGKDRISNCVGQEVEVKKRENGVLENGDCRSNGHVLEIEVNAVEEKHGDACVKRNSKEIETEYDDDKNRENGVFENGDCSADVCVQESKVDPVEEKDGYVNGVKQFEETNIGDHIGEANSNAKDCSMSNGVAGVELLTESMDSKLEESVDENHNRKEEVVKLMAVGGGSESVDGLSGSVLSSPAAETESTLEGAHVDQVDLGMQQGLNQNGGPTMAESADFQMNNVEKSDVELHKVADMDGASPMAAESEKGDMPVDRTEPAKHPELGQMSASALCSSACVESHKVDGDDIEVHNVDQMVDRVDEKMEEESGSHQDAMLHQELEAGHVSVKEADTKLENLSTEEANTAKSDLAIQNHDAITTAAEPKYDVTESEVPSTDKSEQNDDNLHVKEAECVIASAKMDPVLALDDGQGPLDSVNVSSIAVKEESLPAEDEKENAVKNDITDSDAVERRSETKEETDSTVVDASSSCFAVNVSTETEICFGSFGQRELSKIPSEDVIEMREDQNTVPESRTEASIPQADVVDITPQNNVVVAEVPVAVSPKEQNQVSVVEKKTFNFIVRMPRFDDDHLKSKINDAQLQVDEKTKRRDAIKAEMHGKRAVYKESSEKFDAAVTEEKAARELLKSKRQDVDSVQNVINKVKNAISFDEIDAQIRNMEHRIEHETLPLKEEKQMIREIKQLKQLREQVASTMGGQDQLKQALDKKEQTEEHLKTLRKDADSLKENFLKAEAVTKASKKIYYDNSEKLRQLQARFREADEVRQEAYMQLQSLKKELYEKNKHFWKYRDDVKMATDLASKGDRDSLSQFCFEQVENFMEVWNKSSEFREEYLKSNARRTLRRLGTADGRSLGPNEEAPSMLPVLNDRAVQDKCFPSLASTKQEPVTPTVEVGLAADKVLRKDAETKKPKAKTKNAVKAPPQVETLSILERDIIIEETKEPQVTKEERELTRKAEELRKKEEAERLLEQRRLEEKAKAKEAIERKNRNAERAQARAALKAQKEAEQKEKEREKRAKKKERKKLPGNMSAEEIPEGESHSPSEAAVEAVSVEPEVKEKPTPMRRPSKPPHFTKQTKIAPIPPPLRNRGKRKMQTWMWVVLVALLVFALFMAGNVWNLF